MLDKLNLESLKHEALRQGMKLLSHPTVAKMMADPRLMGAITRGLEAKGRVDGGIDRALETFASALKLARSDDLSEVMRKLEQTRRQVEARCNALERKLDSDTDGGAKQSGGAS